MSEIEPSWPALFLKLLDQHSIQDADRLDALGAVGLARTLMLGGELRREFYAAADPFCESRTPDDSVYTLDHLYAKLLTLEGTMQTSSGKTEAHQRTEFLRGFLDQLRDEIESVPAVSAGFISPSPKVIRSS